MFHSRAHAHADGGVSGLQRFPKVLYCASQHIATLGQPNCLLSALVGLHNLMEHCENAIDLTLTATGAFCWVDNQDLANCFSHAQSHLDASDDDVSDRRQLEPRA